MLLVQNFRSLQNADIDSMAWILLNTTSRQKGSSLLRKERVAARSKESVLYGARDSWLDLV